MSKKFNHYELPRSGRSFLHEGDEERVTAEYEVFTDRRGSDQMVQILEGEGHWNWLKDDDSEMAYGTYEGLEQELSGAMVEVDLGTYQGKNATKLYIPKDNL